MSEKVKESVVDSDSQPEKKKRRKTLRYKTTGVAEIRHAIGKFSRLMANGDISVNIGSAVVKALSILLKSHEQSELDMKVDYLLQYVQHHYQQQHLGANDEYPTFQIEGD